VWVRWPASSFISSYRSFRIFSIASSLRVSHAFAVTRLLLSFFILLFRRFGKWVRGAVRHWCTSSFRFHSILLSFLPLITSLLLPPVASSHISGTCPLALFLYLSFFFRRVERGVGVLATRDRRASSVFLLPFISSLVFSSKILFLASLLCFSFDVIAGAAEPATALRNLKRFHGDIHDVRSML
jgi:hypothetical protein